MCGLVVVFEAYRTRSRLSFGAGSLEGFEGAVASAEGARGKTE
jgi:hypothetical protein